MSGGYDDEVDFDGNENFGIEADEGVTTVQYITP